MTTTSHMLDDRAVLSLSGEGVLDWLNNLVSNNAEAGSVRYAALLTPQGKYLFDFLIHADGDTLLLDTDAARLEELTKRLTMYRLRAPITIEPRDDLGVFVGEGAADPRHPKLPSRTIAPRSNAGDRTAYDLQRIKLGVPEGSDIEVDRTFWLEAGAERLHGVDFRKGCFVGQEQTARMKHRGTVKKGYRPFTFEGAAPEAGTKIEWNGKPLGQTCSALEGHVLCFVRLAIYNDAVAEGGPIMAGDTALTPLPFESDLP